MWTHFNRYISTPLLLRGRKFDIRVYMLIVASNPWLVLYRDGYVRLCCEAYQLASQSLAVHLTNQYQQKKNPLYEQVKEDTVSMDVQDLGQSDIIKLIEVSWFQVWDFDKFQECLSNEHGLPQDWVAGLLTVGCVGIESKLSCDMQCVCFLEENDFHNDDLLQQCEAQAQPCCGLL